VRLRVAVLGGLSLVAVIAASAASASAPLSLSSLTLANPSGLNNPSFSLPSGYPDKYTCVPSPPVPTQPSNCTLQPPGGITLSDSFGQDGATFTDQGSGDGVTISNSSCNATLQAVSATYSVLFSSSGIPQYLGGSPTQPTFDSSVTVEQNCAATLTFSDSQHSTLEVNFTSPYVAGCSGSGNPQYGTIGGCVVSGTGAFNGVVGTWTQSCGDCNDPGAGDYTGGLFQPSSGSQRVFAPALRTSPTLAPWSIHLHKGKFEVAIGYPRANSTVSPSDDPGLRIISRPKTACTASAATGTKTVKLGTKTTPASGQVTFASQLTSVLSPGSWSLSISCGTTKTGIATASNEVTIAAS
jgi:hypothetical protein